MSAKRFFILWACAAALLATGLFVWAEEPPATGVPLVWGYDGYGQLGDHPPLQRATPQALSGVPIFLAAAGSYHIAALAADGTCWAWGLNAYGQLGDGTLTSRSTPAPVPGVQGLVSVAAGMNHTVLLKSDGTVWACGVGGAVGDGTTVDRHSPVQVTGLSGIVAISAMGSFTLALKADGTVWAWGSNGSGQLGDGTTALRASPVQVTSLQNVVAIATGYQHSLAVDAAGTVWAWGRNNRGQLGDGTNVNRSTPVQVLGLSGISRVCGGYLFSMALKTDGTVWAWGQNNFGQLGNGTNQTSWSPVQVSGLSGVTRIATGWWHALAATGAGSVYAWGSDTYGECAQGTWQMHNTPQPVAGVSGSRFVAASNGWSMAAGGSTSWTWGKNDTGQLGDGRMLYQHTPRLLAPTSSVTALAGGEFHGLLLLGDGTVGAWGHNEYGQVGNGTFSFVEPPQLVPGLTGVTAIAAGVDHSLAVKSDGTVWAWGENGRGELGNDYMDSSPTPVQVAGLSGVVAVAAGWDLSLALKDDGTVWAWGSNDQGQLGDGSGLDQTSPVQVAGLTSAVGIAAENYANHALAVLADGTVMAWGGNGAGQLGDGTIISRPTPVAVQGLSGVASVAAGAWGFSLAVKNDGTAWAWGANSRGELGDGTTTPSLVPIQVPGLSGITAIRAGDTHVLALKSDGTVWAWGINWFGHTGQSDTSDQLSPLPVPGITGAIGVAAGGDYSMALVTCALTCSPTVPTGTPQGTPVSFVSNVSPGLGCLGTVSYDWDFGDGSPHSSLQNASHSYAIGVYTWILTVSSDGATCTTSGTINVGTGQVPSSERDALIALYNSTGGPGWTRSDNWLGPAGTEGTWFGVALDDTLSHVAGLTLGENNLTGTIPAAIGDLAQLRDLDLSSNDLTGGIPDQIASLGSLEVLYLSWNHQLGGEIPTGLGLQQPNLREVILAGCSLTGTIPQAFGGLSDIRYIDLIWNQLTGTIPPQLGSLQKLEDLRLLGNSLSGTIPPELGNAGSLAILLLGRNKLTGGLPPELCGLTTLRELAVDLNLLDGSLPPALGGLTALTALKLDGNSFSGEVPSTLAALTSLPAGGLDLRWNALTTTDPGLLAFLNSKQLSGSWTATQTVAPSGASATPVDARTLQVQWTPIAYQADGGAYQIFMSTSPTGPFALLGATADKSEGSFTAGQLQPATTYYFTVRTLTDPHVSNPGTATSAPTATFSATTCPELAITAQPQSTATLTGTSVTLSVAASSTGVLSYQWYEGASGDTSAPAGTDSASFTTPALAQTTGYWVRVSTGCGPPVDSITATVTVCALSCSASASVSSGVGPLSVSFTGDFGGGGACSGAATYDWDFGDGTPHSTQQNPTHVYATYGLFNWMMTATLGGQACTQTGTVHVNACTVTCSASVDKTAGDTGTLFTFSSTVLHPDCGGTPSVDWDFGDGSAHGSGATASHTYGQPGTYTWTMMTALGGGQCSSTGQVFVAAPVPSAVQGSVGIRSGGSFWPFNTDAGSGGISGLQVYAVAQGSSTHIPPTTLTESTFNFIGLTPGVAYTLYAEFDYADQVTQGNDDLAGYGCPAPGTVTKHVVSQGVDVTPAQGTTTFADVAFPPPLVMLHGLLECYERWTSSDAGDTTHWDDAARAAGFLSFTPNYTWWLPEGSWGQSSDQILAQVKADLAGLVGTPPASLGAGAPAPVSWPPYAVVAYDMGGLMVRVLTSGPHRGDPAVRAMAAAFLLGVPNSGTDVVLGGGPEDILNSQVIVQSFNEIYPDFGEKTPAVFAMAGDAGWWGLNNSDGVVSLPSTFTVQRQVCSDDGSGTITCRTYAQLTLNSAPAEQHVFHYNHDGLGSPPSTGDILTGVILPAVKTDLSGMAGLPAERHGTPEAPGSTSIWGSTIRTVGQASGTVHRTSQAGETTATSYPFYISATDGMAVSAFVSQGSATMAVVDANGRTVASRTGVTGTYTYTQMSPPASTQSTPWNLVVTPEAGGATFQATFFEDGLFGTNGYATQHTYQPGAPMTLRVDLEGILTGLSVGSVTATVPWSGNPIPLSAAGATAYTATVNTPATGGTYPVLFQTTGTDPQGASFTRWNYDRIDVLSPTRLFTGGFTDAAVDQNGDGLKDVLRFTAPVVYASGGYLMVSGDLVDSGGGFVSHASSTAQVPAGSQGTSFQLTFGLGAVHCDQFGAPFQVQGLQVVNGATLAPLDTWSGGVPTATYASTGFQCLQGAPQPVVTSVQPGQGARGQHLTLLVGGHGFRSGATVSVGPDVTVDGAQRVDDTLITASLTVPSGAALGEHDLVVTNTDGTTVTAAGAFSVTEDQPPTVAIQSLTGLLDGNVLPPSPGPVTVAATATDDRRVATVDFLMDDGSGNYTVKATVNAFPYRWTFDPGTVMHGAHAIKARAHDDSGQTADSPSVTVYASPPTVTSVTGGGAPWQLKVLGTNFLQGLTVTIGADAAPWSNVVFKSSTKILVKGGKALKARFPKGQAVAIRVQNPDGTGVTASYTRP